MKAAKARVVLLVVLSTLLAPAPAAAKGAMGATVDGDGIAAPVELDLAGRWELADDLGLYSLAYGPAPGPLPAVVPAGDLGPELVVAWELATGPDTTAIVREQVYPFADGGPWAHVAPGQPLGTASTVGGWLRVPAGVGEALRAAGAPVDAVVAADDDTRSLSAAPGDGAGTGEADRAASPASASTSTSPSGGEGAARPALPVVAAVAAAGVVLVRMAKGAAAAASRWRRPVA